MAQEFSDLRVFCRVVECHGFSAAARALGVSTAAVSKTITQMEQRYGSKLFERTTRQLCITEAGQRFYLRCVEILQSYSDAEAELSLSTSRVSGTLKVTAPVEFTNLYLSVWLPEFMRRYPELQVIIDSSNQVTDLREAQVDCAIRFARDYDGSLKGRKLGRTRLLAVASPAYLKKNPSPKHPNELSQHRGIVFSGPVPWTDFSWKHGKVSGVAQLTPTLASSSTTLLYNALLKSTGLAIMPTLMASQGIKEKQLIVLLPEYDFGSMSVYMLFPEKRLMPKKTRVFIDFLREYLGDTPEKDLFLPEEF